MVHGGEGFVLWHRSLDISSSAVCSIVSFAAVSRQATDGALSRKSRRHQCFQAGAIYRLFVAAEKVLLRGLLNLKDDKVYFETLNPQITPLWNQSSLSIVEKLQIRYAPVTHSDAS